MTLVPSDLIYPLAYVGYYCAFGRKHIEEHKAEVEEEGIQVRWLPYHALLFAERIFFCLSHSQNAFFSSQLPNILSGTLTS